MYMLFTLIDRDCNNQGERENLLHVALENNSPADILESIIKR